VKGRTRDLSGNDASALRLQKGLQIKEK